MGIVSYIAKSRPFGMMFMFNADEENDAIQWHETGIKRYIAFNLIVAYGIAFGLMTYLDAFPSYRIYTILLIMGFVIYSKLSEAVPMVFDDMEEFEIEFEPSFKESGFYEAIEKQLNSQKGLTFNPEPVDKDE